VRGGEFFFRPSRNIFGAKCELRENGGAHLSPGLCRADGELECPQVMCAFNHTPCRCQTFAPEFGRLDDLLMSCGVRRPSFVQLPRRAAQYGAIPHASPATRSLNIQLTISRFGAARSSLKTVVRMSSEEAAAHGEGISEEDRGYMALALGLARKGEGKTFPNPCVGCVLVKNGEIVGEGYHPKAGMPHAEVYALYMAGEQAEGSTAYVTLEPCNHHGRTPPCSQGLVDAKVARVVVGMPDPNPLVNSEGIAHLRSHGIPVDIMDGEQAQEARAITADFVKRITAPAPAQDIAPVAKEAETWGAELVPMVREAVSLVQECLRTGGKQNPAVFSEEAATALLQEKDGKARLLPLSDTHFMFAGTLPSGSPCRWVVVAGEGTQGPSETIALALLNDEGQVVLAVLGNNGSREDACVMAAVRGGGLRYFGRSETKSGQMTLSQVSDMPQSAENGAAGTLLTPKMAGRQHEEVLGPTRGHHSYGRPAVRRYRAARRGPDRR